MYRAKSYTQLCIINIFLFFYTWVPFGISLLQHRHSFCLPFSLVFDVLFTFFSLVFEVLFTFFSLVLSCKTRLNFSLVAGVWFNIDFGENWGHLKNFWSGLLVEVNDIVEINLTKTIVVPFQICVRNVVYYSKHCCVYVFRGLCTQSEEGAV